MKIQHPFPFLQFKMNPTLATILCAILIYLMPLMGYTQFKTTGIPFQGIAKDQSNQSVNKRPIYIDLSLYSASSNQMVLYNELHKQVTDEWGIFSIVIGNGIRNGGLHQKITEIDWSKGDHFLQIKIAIEPEAPIADWDYKAHFITMPAAPFGVVPYALFSLASNSTEGSDPFALLIKDTAQMLTPYFRKLDTMSIFNRIHERLKITDTLNLSNRIDARALLADKSTNMRLVSDYSDLKYPSVKAAKDYMDAALIAGAPDADINTKGILKLTGDLSGTANFPTIAVNSISTDKVLDGAITDAKIAFGINPSKVGLGNLTNHAQLYSLNGLTQQIQQFTAPGLTGTSPNWVSSGAGHQLNLPLASAVGVTAGLISKLDYDHFHSAYTNHWNTLTTLGDAGPSTLTGQNLNIPHYSLTGLSGNVNANSVFAGPISGGIGSAGFRSLVALDIPNNFANTSGNAATATKLIATKNINGVAFDGSTDITIQANTSNSISFTDNGLGMLAGGSFNGAVPKVISYNTIGAAPSMGASSITSVGSISSGTWAADIIGANYGGAGNVMGLLKANGAGIVSAAISGTDFVAPFGAQSARHFYAAPNLSNGNPVFRSILASDIPLLNQSTTGNAATASALQTNRLINGIGFDGTADITIQANTRNALTFNNEGTGVASGASFNGATANTISYNTIGAAPATGASSITQLGTITAGTWSATVIDQKHGGAGNINGVLKANGLGVVSQAIAGTDFQLPLSFSSPLVLNASTLSIPQANQLNSGYLSTTDWMSFNNKINTSLLGVQNGVATLDGSGKIPTSQIPAISFSSGYVVNNQNDMLGLSNAVVGSIAIRTDNSKNYVLSASDPTVLSNWLELLMPAAISAVNGLTSGSITLSTFHIGENTNLYFTDARARAAITVASPLTYSSASGLISLPAATTSTAGYLTNNDWNTFNNKLNVFGAQAAHTFFAGPSSGLDASPVFRTLQADDVPILNQSTTGNAATASKLLATKNINGVPFDGTSDITIAAAISNAIQFNASGTGANSPISFDGTTAKTISYNSIGAAPAIGSSAITNLGTIQSGVWEGTVIDANHGGAGIVNGLMKANGAGIVSAAVVGTDYLAPFTAQTSKYFYAAPNSTNGSPVFRAILSSDIPLLNQSTTGNAATSTALLNARTINGVPFDGTADITLSANSSNALTFNSSGTGAAVSSSFNGASPMTISYNSIGALPTTGAVTVTTLGTVNAGTWNANLITGQYGGTGVNNLNKTITIGGNINTAAAFTTIGANAIILNTTSPTNITLPTSGTLATLSGMEILANKSIVNATAITVTGDVTAKRYLSTSPAAITAASTTTLDLSIGNVITINLGTSVNTLNVTGAAIGTYLIKFVQDATGSREVSFPTGWKWAGGVIPNLTNTANKIDIVTLIYDGTNYYATIVQNF